MMEIPVTEMTEPIWKTILKICLIQKGTMVYFFAGCAGYRRSLFSD